MTQTARLIYVVAVKEVALPTGQHNRNSVKRPIESVQRAMQLLTLFVDSESASGVSVTEAAVALRLNKSTASRLFQTLCQAGFVILNPETRRYHVGPAAFVLGSRFEGGNIARAVLPMLHELARTTASTAQVGTLLGPSVVYLAVAQSNERLRVMAGQGDTRYAHGSAMGKAILASMSPPEVAEHLAPILLSSGTLPSAGPRTIVDPLELAHDLEVTRLRGYAISVEESTAGAAAVGVHVRSPREYPLAISVAFAKGTYSDQQYPELASAVKTTADSVALNLYGTQRSNNELTGD